MNAAAAPGQHALWTAESGERARSIFAVEGIRCAACARTIERAVGAVPGVERASVNGATARVAVDWNPAATSLEVVLAAVSAAGFRPLPLSGELAERAWTLERRAALKRIGLAGLGMMQTMMFSAGLYASRRTGIDPGIAAFLKFVSLLVVTPILVYSGAPFFRGAWTGLRQRTAGMDLPVALALALAYVASAWDTLRGSGETYFDSVAMFIFLLLVGRYLEMTVRHRTLSASEALTRSLPATVLRVEPDGTTRRIPLGEIVAGDLLSIPKGAVIPVDGRLEIGRALIDESLVTGEGTPIERGAGDPVAGGAVNAGQPLRLRAASTVSGSTLASVVGLLERAQAERPRVTSAADRAAAWFILAILAVAAGTAVAWWFIDPARVFPAVLAVLVVTCPCALSLATPAAVAAATTRLARAGVLVSRADAIERLSRVDTVVLDKTGTLTLGALRIGATELATPAAGSDAAARRAEALAIAAALGRESAHPLGGAFAPHARAALVATAVREEPGLGLEGEVAGTRWRLGRHEFVTGSPATAAGDSGPRSALASVWLGRVDPARCAGATVVAAFEVCDTLRPGTEAAIRTLRELGLEVVIASGDRPDAVARIAAALGITQGVGALRPEDKTAVVRALQAGGHRVLMIGDGINDAPVLATADVSCAMGQGSAIAQVAADLLLLNDSLLSIAESVVAARLARRVLRQNLGWALCYNFAAVPLAALGLVLPWVAAIGMSLSSLGVVLNARRITTARLGAARAAERGGHRPPAAAREGSCA